MSEASPMIDVRLGRIVIEEGQTTQFIYLTECRGERGFPILIGSNEAEEIRRVVHREQTMRPLTHHLCYATIRELGAELRRVDIVDLQENTFYARLVLETPDPNGDPVPHEVDARPSDAIALALRAKCPLRVAEHVLEKVWTPPQDDGSSPPPDATNPPPPE